MASTVEGNLDAAEATGGSGYVVRDLPEDQGYEERPDPRWRVALRERMADPDRPSFSARIGLPVLTSGLCVLLFFAYVYAFTGFQEARTQRQMLDTFTTPAGAVPLSGKVPADGSPTAVLRVPSLGIHEVVVQGTTATYLAKGPGVLTQAARPGTIGNAVILGRRVTAGAPLGQIGELKVGAVVKVSTGLGRFRYRVVEVGSTKPGQLSPASPRKGRWLTLMTANSSTRPTGYLYARAKLTSDPAASTKPHTPPTADELGLVGDPSARWPSVIWSLILAIVLGTTFWAYRRLHRQLATVYLLTTPVVLATALVAFSNLYRLLPGAM